MYPTLLEFSVEATYPNDESVVVALIIIYSSIQGVFLLYLADLTTTKATDIKFANVVDSKGCLCTHTYMSLSFVCPLGNLYPKCIAVFVFLFVQPCC